jgi:hypothetical protein
VSEGWGSYRVCIGNCNVCNPSIECLTLVPVMLIHGLTGAMMLGLYVIVACDNEWSVVNLFFSKPKTAAVGYPSTQPLHLL